MDAEVLMWRLWEGTGNEGGEALIQGYCMEGIK